MLSPIQNAPYQVCSVNLERAPLPLHAMPISAGFERVQNKSYDWRGQDRGPAPFALIQHTTSGFGRLTFHGQDFVLEPGHTMVLTLPGENRYWLPPKGDWEFYWICLNGREALRLISKIISVNGPVLRLGGGDIGRVASLCLDLLANKHKSPLAASAATYDCIMALAESLIESRGISVLQASEGLRDVETYIAANLNKHITIDTLAEIAGYSKFHFCRVFRAAKGESPAAYLKRSRLALSVQLMQSGTTSIKTISNACGFGHPNYFTKCFRKKFGVSPTEFLNAGPTERGIILQG